jgi:hypothetical protein
MSEAATDLRTNPMHSIGTDDWGTPGELVTAIRTTMGAIDLDVCSHWYWNEHVVRATEHYGTQAPTAHGEEFVDGLARPWRGRILCNPPGDKRGELVKAFWRKAQWHPNAHRGDALCWVGYSLEQLQSLQRIASPLAWPTCVIKGRVRYLRKVDGGPPVPGGSPTHGSFVTLLSFDHRMRERFRQTFKAFGHVSGVS